MVMIKTVNLTKKYKEKVAVDNLNLEVNEGEILSFLGVNGAGKTTTIKMLSCITRPTNGDAFLFQKSIKSEQQEIKKHINISPQETAIAPNLTVRENLELIAEIYGQDKKEAKKSVEKISKTFGLTKELKSKSKTLSGGMQRRLSISMALISEPKILFLDEPTLGLDVLARRELWTAIKSLKGKVTMILTTHYLEEVEALSDKVAVMSDGKLIAVGTVEELLKQTNTNSLEDAFVSLAGGKYE